jgi:hypothetical protein
MYTSAQCKFVWKQHAVLPDTSDDFTSASKYFSMLPYPSGAKHKLSDYATAFSGAPEFDL